MGCRRSEQRPSNPLALVGIAGPGQSTWQNSREVFFSGLATLVVGLCHKKAGCSAEMGERSRSYQTNTEGRTLVGLLWFHLELV